MTEEHDILRARRTSPYSTREKVARSAGRLPLSPDNPIPGEQAVNKQRKRLLDLRPTSAYILQRCRSTHALAQEY